METWVLIFGMDYIFRIFYTPYNEVIKMVNFKLLLELANELRGSEYPIEETIGHLAMSDIAMTDAVIKLGIACDVLEDGYKNGWSEED